jgi:thiol-disulfide isomerase/thioredoxin
LLLLLVFAGAALGQAMSASSGASAGPRAPLGRSSAQARAPLDLKLPLYPSRRMHDLAKDRGNVVLLDVWATWCEPCLVALPVYERLLKQYGKRGFKVYAINVDEDQDDIPPFIKLTKLSLPVLLDQDAEITEAKLGVRMMPTSFVLDRQGRIRHVHEGFAPDSLTKYQAEIEALLAEKAPVEAHADP